MAAHDVRNPLAGLELQLGLLERTASKGQPSPATLLEHVATCHRFVARASSLLGSLLDAAQIGAGKLKLQLERVDLAQVAQEVAARSRGELEAARCDLTLDLGLPVESQWDRSRLDQVVTNLLSNALKYGRGKPVEIAVRQKEGSGVLTVRDHGIGISPGDQKRIFHQFERVATDGIGAGLGLWIVRQIASALGGQIDVQSEVGKGSTFALRLPLRGPAAGETASPPP